MRPDLLGAAVRRHGVEALGLTGDLSDGIEQHFGPQPLAVVPRVIAGVDDIPLARQRAESVDVRGGDGADEVLHVEAVIGKLAAERLK